MQFWTSDQHYFHYNIIRLCSRPFSDMTEMINTIISNHNSVVSDRDEVWNLGDFSYKADPENVVKILKRLNGKQKLLLANHDKALRIAYEKRLLDDLIKSGKVEIIGGVAALDRELAISKMLNINGQLIFISHYGLRTWPNAFRGSWNLYGHSHSHLPPLYKSMDIGVDCKTETHKGFSPWSFDEIKTEMDKVTSTFKE